MRRGAVVVLLALLTSACSAGPTATQTATSTTEPVPTPESTSTPGLDTPTPTAATPTAATPTASASPGAGSPTPPPTPADALDWSPLEAGAGPSAREDHTWTVDGDETTAFLFGGRDGGDISNELWRFDLQTDTWAIAAPSGDAPQPRFGHTATWVPNVGLVVWSGQADGNTFFDDIWAYDPAVNAWRELPSLGDVPPARYGSCASLGPDGRLWISHGFTDSGRFDDTRAYDFATGEWTDETPEGDLPIQRCLHDCYWSSDETLVLYGGQTNGVPALGDLWLFDPGAAAWQKGPQQPAAPRQLYALAAPSGNGIIFGGGSGEGGYLDDTWVIDHTNLELGEDQKVTRPPARSGATLIPAGDFRFLLFGGRNDEGAQSDLWELSGFFSTHP